MTSKREHFILIKHPSELNDCTSVTATEAAKALLDAGFWPLFEGTRCRLMVRAGNKVLIYTAGQGKDSKRFIASATVSEVKVWDRKLAVRCPIFLEGIPVSALILGDIQYFDSPRPISDVLDNLSFIPANRQKWGVAMMGGMRSIDARDYEILTGGQSIRPAA
jgi:hypothetical protein